MYKYACLNSISPKGLADFGENYQLTDELAEADGIIVRSAKMHDMDIPRNVKCIVRAGVGVNNIPMDQCNEKGIVVFNTPGANANAVKEMVISAMLMASRDIIGGANCITANCDQNDVKTFAEQNKKQFGGTEIAGKTLGVIGLGEIGVLVANAAISLGMKVQGYDPYLSVKHAWSLDRGVKRVLSADDIYENCDYITIHIPLVESTKHTINRQAIGQMRDGVILINYARDILCDEEAVLEGIESGKIRKYVTDFANSVVAGKKNVIVTPHIGASTFEAEENSAKMAVDEMKNFLENGNINHSISYSNCDMGVCESACRLSICHKNVPNMIANFTKNIGGAGLNIAKMLNSSKGDFAYSLFDLDAKAPASLIGKLMSVDEVIRVRVL